MEIPPSLWHNPSMLSRAGRQILLLLLAAGAVRLAPAQSSRPGWGSVPYHDAAGTGVTFRVWAPNATSVFVPGDFNGWSQTATPLGKDLTNGVWNGCWSGDVSGATNGQQYKYYLHYPGGNGYLSGNTVWRHDPRARKVVNAGTSAGDNDIIYDPAAFNWTNDVAPTPAQNDLVIYELHIGTFYATNAAASPQGKFTDATNRLDYVKSLGVSAVEVMPISEFPDPASWGYDPVDLFAADNASYGGPDGFKALVKACHARGLAVLLDVVQNHYGQTDLDLWDFDGWSGNGNGGGDYFYQTAPQCCTSWGGRPNYSRPAVCDFIQQNFQMWLGECHVDGFRWDTPDTMRYAGSTYIPEAVTLINNINAFIHTNYTGKFSIAEDVQGVGFDSTWDTSYPGAVTPILASSTDAGRDLNALAGYLAYNVRFGGNAGANRVAFLESHDVVGDLNNGTRLATAIDAATPDSWRARKLSLLGAALTFTAPGVPLLFQGQEMLENQPFSSSRPVDWSKTNTYRGIVNGYRDLIALRRNFDGGTAGLKGDQISFLQIDNSNKLLAYRRWSTSNPTQDVVVVANLTGAARTNVTVPFPRAGNWFVHFNTDATNYSGDFTGLGTNAVVATGANPAAALTLGAYSVQVLSPAPLAPALTVTLANRSKTIAWPVAYAGWTLQSATNLGGNAAGWTAVSPTLYQTNAGVISVTFTPAGANLFYRLQQP